jgi:hypothetical protein
MESGKGDDMKKPLNKISPTLWICAVLFVLARAWTFVTMFQTTAEMRAGTYYLVIDGISRLVQSTVAVAATLTGMGVLIELVDQIRWTLVRASGKS